MRHPVSSHLRIERSNPNDRQATSLRMTSQLESPSLHLLLHVMIAIVRAPSWFRILSSDVKRSIQVEVLRRHLIQIEKAKWSRVELLLLCILWLDFILFHHTPRIYEVVECWLHFFQILLRNPIASRNPVIL